MLHDSISRGPAAPNKAPECNAERRRSVARSRIQSRDTQGVQAMLQSGILRGSRGQLCVINQCREAQYGPMRCQRSWPRGSGGPTRPRRSMLRGSGGPSKAPRFKSAELTQRLGLQNSMQSGSAAPKRRTNATPNDPSGHLGSTDFNAERLREAQWGGQASNLRGSRRPNIGPRVPRREAQAAS